MYIKIVLYLLSTTPPGFRGDHRDRAMRDLDVPPVESEHDHGEGDPDPCPEDEEYFVRPDAAEMEKAIGKFLMAWRDRSAVASRQCTVSLQSYLCHLQRNQVA